jgi:hypothetical protein
MTIIPPWLYVAVAAVALAVGAASGAGIMRSVKNGEIAELKLTHANAVIQAAEKARKETNEARDTADSVRSEPVVRVRCYADSPKLPGAGAGVVGNDLPDSGGAPESESLGTAELQEFLAAAVANRGMEK